MTKTKQIIKVIPVMFMMLSMVGCATIGDRVQDEIDKLPWREEQEDTKVDMTAIIQDSRNVLPNPGTLITWYTPDEKQKRVMQYDSGYYHPNSMSPASVAKKRWDAISKVAESVGANDFRTQNQEPVAYWCKVLSWWEPRGVRAPNVTDHTIWYDGGYGINFEVGNSRDHFGKPGSAHGYIVNKSGQPIVHMNVNHSETSMRY